MLYTVQGDDRRRARVNARGVWWCGHCDRSHMPSITRCQGCNAVLEDAMDLLAPPVLPAMPGPALEAAEVVPAGARLHPDLRAEIEPQDIITVPVEYKQRPDDRRRPGRPKKGK